MTYHIAQLNIARFRLPQEHPDNADFVNNLDRINEIAEQQDGFVWRFKGDGNDALDVKAFDDPNVASNMSLWKSLEALSAFVYRNREHREIMRRRHEWFDKIDFYLVLWWVEAGQIPSIDDAKARLRLLESIGASEQAFTFKTPFCAPSGDRIPAVFDDCA
ncbi:MAG: DUF3291 domain-containing protein [Arenicella sp.]|nr:DUF3291 domain-containing protein [Arenicella sp.]